MEQLLKEWKLVLIVALTGLLTLTAWLLNREMHAFAEFKAAVVVLGREAEKEAARVNELHQRTLKETRDEWEKELPTIRTAAINNYMRRFPHGLCGNSSSGNVSGTTGDPKTSDGAVGERMASGEATNGTGNPEQDAFIAACGKDAGKLRSLRAWATKNKLKVE